MTTVGLKHYEMRIGGEWVDADGVKNVHLDLSGRPEGRPYDVLLSESPAREERA